MPNATMKPMRVKICGITSVQDARLAEEAGADAIGLILAEGSKRQLSLEAAEVIADAVGPFVSLVGVFRNQPLEFVLAAAARLRLAAVQLHGHEPVQFVAAVRERHRVIRAVAFEPGLTVQALDSWQADGILLDAPQPGSGTAFDWDSAAATFRGMTGLILAGGLTPANVAEAISRFAPAAVDVASGVEAAPGIKSPDLVRQFLAGARQLTALSTGRSVR